MARLPRLLYAAAVALAAVGLLVIANGPADAQQGPFSAQITRALRSVHLAGTTGGSSVFTGTLLQFGGTTASFPALKRSSGILQVRFADDNAYASFEASSVGINAAAPGLLGSARYGAVTFSGLGTPANGTLAYCSDCTVTTAATCPGTQASCICAGSGGGAFARRVNGAWYCTF